MASRVITKLNIELPAANCFLILFPPIVPSHNFIVVAVSPPTTIYAPVSKGISLLWIAVSTMATVTELDCISRVIKNPINKNPPWLTCK